MKELLTINPRALQFLHSAKGFDFKAPFFFQRFEGRFTYNGIVKAIREHIPGAYSACVLVQATEKRHFHDKLYFVKMSVGGFDVARVNAAYHFQIDNFYGVGDFEDCRKHQTKTAFVFAQALEYIKPIREKALDTAERYGVDYSDRWSVRKCCDGHGIEWVSQINLTARDGSKHVFVYSPVDRWVRAGVVRPVTAADIIDKSGYLIWQRRKDLRRKAAKLREDRAREAAKVADFTEEEKEIEAGIKSAREAIAKRALHVMTEVDAGTVERMARALRNALYRYEYYKNATYRNTEGRKADITRVMEHLNDVMKEA